MLQLSLCCLQGHLVLPAWMPILNSSCRVCWHTCPLPTLHGAPNDCKQWKCKGPNKRAKQNNVDPLKTTASKTRWLHGTNLQHYFPHISHKIYQIIV